MPELKLHEIPDNHYGCIIADPPWQFRTYSAKGEAKSPQAHYRVMSLDGIKNMPVEKMAAMRCVLLLWATAPMLPQAIEVMTAWGFEYKSALAWAKRSKADTGWSFGTGYWLRSAAEFLLLGTSGSPSPQSRRTRNLIVSPVRAHSRKPDCQYEIAEALARGPYLELFSRTSRDGWDSFGDEAGTFRGEWV